MRLMAGMTDRSWRMLYPMACRSRIMTGAAKLINIVPQQIFLPRMRLMGFMAGKTITLKQRFVQRFIPLFL
jgi:hypothetical protein